jgi:hypothetical protein
VNVNDSGCSHFGTSFEERGSTNLKSGTTKSRSGTSLLGSGATKGLCRKKGK